MDLDPGNLLLCKRDAQFCVPFLAESLDEDDSSDDEPLSRVAKKLQPQRKRKPAAERAKPVIKSKRNAAMKKGPFGSSSLAKNDFPTMHFTALK